MRKIRFTLLALLLTPLIAHAQSQPAESNGLDKYSQEALEKTQKLLTDPAQRQKAIATDQKAQAVHKQVEMVSGSPQNTDKMYQMAAEIMKTVAVQANGNPAKMQELMMQAQRDPAAFLRSLPHEHQAQIQAIAHEATRKRQQDAVKAGGR